MASPDDAVNISQLDVQNLPPEEQARLARAQQAALAAQQQHALLGMLGTVPELQKAGAAQYEQAGRERAGGREQSANVLKFALEKTGQERQLAALQQQIEYQRGQLGLQGQQLGLEGARLQAEMFRPFLNSLLESQGKVESINAVASHFGDLGKKLGDIAKLPAEARVKAIQDVFGMSQQAMGGKVPTAPKSALPKSTGKTPAPKAPAAPAGADPWAAMRQKYGGLAKAE
jgi:hypothetical protein